MEKLSGPQSGTRLKFDVMIAANPTGLCCSFVGPAENQLVNAEANLINSIDSRTDPTLSWLDYSWNKLHKPWQDIQTCGAPLYETPLTRGSLYTQVSNDFPPIYIYITSSSGPENICKLL